MLLSERGGLSRPGKGSKAKCQQKGPDGRRRQQWQQQQQGDDHARGACGADGIRQQQANIMNFYVEKELRATPEYD